MRTTFISTLAMGDFTRLSLLKSQAKLAQASTEASTGRYADVGVSIGYKTGQAVSFRQDVDRLTAITDSNNAVATRLKVSQTALGAMKDAADKFFQTALTAVSGSGEPASIATEASAGLNGLFDKLNTTYDGAYIFSGINSDVRPMKGYAGQPAQTAIQAAFTTAFSGPASAITPTQMSTFLNGPFAAEFSTANWDANWSDASSTNVKSRISSTETIETSANANADPFKQMAMAYTMMSDLNNAQLNPDTRKAVAQKAADLMSAAANGLSSMQGSLAVPEQRISDSNDRIDIQKSILTSRINQIEGVDQNEASLRVDALKQQIDLSYAITGKLQQLNILDYL